ncbi:MAG: 23S rRNA (adenine(2030)-N(6))-methyltransferase RlmJ [Paracoccaceae bacterium]|nr:23S rRNA (adenine(2030)-N(6))-methyltransferase RlmJ [Paracoccaceae bacterium]
MLSYQHAYHAGNLADVHKHAVLAWVLDYLTRKDKPLSYLETHAGRGLYDLAGVEATKTGEAAQGIARARAWFEAGHPYLRALDIIQQKHGDSAYPGSPLIARALLRPSDSLQLAELHPGEHAALRANLQGATLCKQDGFAMAQSVCPPTPRRGLLLVDPSYEVKAEYKETPKQLAQIARKWNVGVLMLWYPILQGAPHAPMLRDLQARLPEGIRHEVRFPPAREGHRMVGSGLWLLNAPYGIDAELQRLSKRFEKAMA